VFGFLNVKELSMVTNNGLLGRIWFLVWAGIFSSLRLSDELGAHSPSHVTDAVCRFTPSVMEVEQTECEAGSEIQSGAKLHKS